MLHGGFRASRSAGGAKRSTRFRRRSSRSIRRSRGEAARHGRHHRQQARLPHRRGDPGVLSRRAVRVRSGAGRHLQPRNGEAVRRLFSENMGPEQWRGTAEAIGREIERGVQGIVIGHGTDTMHHTAAILSFMVQNSPVPIVMVGSQRSSDRPSSDAALNLMHSVKAAAESDIAEVMVCMFGPDVGCIRAAAPRHPRAEDALELPLDVPDHRRHPARHGRAATRITPLRDDYKRRRDGPAMSSIEHRVRGAASASSTTIRT
ncbi:MAG: asparaginase domain-containing protein [Bacillus subtilis]|nr:asparaginase domain-containing protein [Bacillus subtilis]